jgi:hypothetical protein
VGFSQLLSVDVGAASSGAKLAGQEADLVPKISAEVKNVSNYISFSEYALTVY